MSNAKFAVVQLIGGQYETFCHDPITVKYTTMRGLMQRAAKLRNEHATFGDNFAGWIMPDVIISLGATKRIEFQNFYGWQTAVIPEKYEDTEYGCAINHACHDARENGGYLVAE
jgi:hypothetical protein